MKTTNKKEEKKFPVNFNELSEEEMINLLVELTDSIYWPAIQKYNRERDFIISQTFYSIDPAKEPTQIARAQGNRTGIYDLESGIMNVKEKRQKKVEQETKKM